MSERELSIVAGALARHQKPKVSQVQDAIAKRWRLAPLSSADQPPKQSDVIPLLDGWIRRLEKEAGCDSVKMR
jgi:hypothetical protein